MLEQYNLQSRIHLMKGWWLSVWIGVVFMFLNHGADGWRRICYSPIYLSDDRCHWFSAAFHCKVLSFVFHCSITGGATVWGYYSHIPSLLKLGAIINFYSFLVSL